MPVSDENVPLDAKIEAKATSIMDAYAKKAGNQEAFATHQARSTYMAGTRPLIPQAETQPFVQAAEPMPATLGQDFVRTGANIAGDVVSGVGVLTRAGTQAAQFAVEKAGDLTGVDTTGVQEGIGQVGSYLAGDSPVIAKIINALGGSIDDEATFQLSSTIADWLNETNGHLGATPAMGRLAMRTQEELQRYEKGSTSAIGLAADLALDTITDPAAVIGTVVTILPAIVSLVGPGKFVTPIAAIANAQDEAVTNAVINTSREYIRDSIIGGNLPQNLAETLQKLAGLAETDEQVLQVATIAQAMNQDYDTGHEFLPPTDDDIMASRLLGGAGAAIDWGGTALFKSLNPIGSAKKLAAKGTSRMQTAVRAPTSVVTEAASEGAAAALEDMAGSTGSLTERFNEIDPANVIESSIVGGIGAGGVSVATSPMTKGAVKAVAKGAQTAAQKVAEVARPTVTKVTDLLGPTKETNQGIVAANEVAAAGIVDRTKMQVKGQAVAEDYNPIAAAMGVLDRGMEFAKETGANKAETADMIQSVYAEAHDHLKNAIDFAGQVMASDTATPKQKADITAAVDTLYGRNAFVSQELSKQATAAILDNDSDLTPTQLNAAKDIILGSLFTGSQTIEELKDLADLPAFRNDAKATGKLAQAISAAEAQQTFQEITSEEVSSQYINGNPNRKGHMGTKQYLEQAEAAARVGDKAKLDQLAQRMTNWIKTGEKLRVTDANIKAIRAAERVYLGSVLQTINSLRKGVSSTASPIAPAPQGATVKRDTFTDTPEPLYTDVVKASRKAAATAKTPADKARAALAAAVREHAKQKEGSAEFAKTAAYIGKMRERAESLGAAPAISEPNYADVTAAAQKAAASANTPVEKASAALAAAKAIHAKQTTGNTAYAQTAKYISKMQERADSLGKSAVSFEDAFATLEEEFVKSIEMTNGGNLYTALAELAEEILEVADKGKAVLQARVKAFARKLQNTGELTSREVAPYDQLASDLKAAIQGMLNSVSAPVALPTPTEVTPNAPTEVPADAQSPAPSTPEVSAESVEVTGSAAKVVTVRAENAPSALLNGKSLPDLVTSPNSTHNRAKGIFTYILNQGSVLTNGGIIKDRVAFVKAIGEKVREKFPKATAETVAEIGKQVNKLSRMLIADQDKGLIDNEGKSGGVFTSFEAPLNLLLVQGADGKLTLPETIRATIQIAALNWANALGRKNVNRGIDGVRDMLGLGEFDSVPDVHLALLSTIGTSRSVVARNIGNDIYHALGIKFDAEKVPAGFENNFKSALGVAAIGYLVQKGVVVNKTIPAATWAKIQADTTGKTVSADLQDLTFVQLVTEDNIVAPHVEAILEPMHVFPAMADTVLANDTAPVLATTDPVAKASSTSSRNTQIDSRLVDALGKYQEIPYRLNQNLRFILEQDNAQELLEDLLGVTDFNPADHHVLVRAARESAVNGTKREISQLVDAFNANPEFLDKDFYLQSEFSFQLRNMMINDDINPQNAKSHRAFVAPAAANVKVTADTSAEDLQVLRDGILTQLGADESISADAALNGAIALNAAVHNVSEDVGATLQNILDGNIKVTSKLITETLNEFFLEPSIATVLKTLKEGAPTGLEGLNIALNIFQLGQLARGEISSFTGQFEVEIDGKTNGFMLLLSQMPLLNNMPTWLQRVGVYVEGLTPAKSFGEYINKDGSLDSYQAVGVEALNSGIDPQLEGFLQFMFGDLQTASGGVAKALREIMKNPFMIFNYGASIARINKDARLALENGIIAKAESIHAGIEKAKVMPKGEERNAALTKMRDELETFNDWLGTGFTSQNLLEDHRTMAAAIESIVHRRSHGFGEEAISTYGTLFAETITNAIESSLGELVPVRDTVNSMFRHQWSMYDTALTAGMARLEAAGEVTQAEVEVLLKNLAPLLPHYHSYTESKGAGSVTRVPIFNTEVVLTENSKVQVKFKSDVLPNQQSMTVQALRTKITDGGVSGFSIAVHSQDAIIMARLYEEGFQLQGRHDAEAVSAVDRVKASQAANRITAEVMSQYSMLHDFFRSTQESVKYATDRGAEVSPESVLTTTHSLALLRQQIEAVDANRKTLFDGKEVTIDQYPIANGKGAVTVNMKVKDHRIQNFNQVTEAQEAALTEFAQRNSAILENVPNELIPPSLVSARDSLQQAAEALGITADGTPVQLFARIAAHVKLNPDALVAFPSLELNRQAIGDALTHNLSQTFIKDGTNKSVRVQTPMEASERSALMAALTQEPAAMKVVDPTIVTVPDVAAVADTPVEGEPVLNTTRNIQQDAETAKWFRRSLASFISANKNLITNPDVYDTETLTLKARYPLLLKELRNNEALRERFAMSPDRVAAHNIWNPDFQLRSLATDGVTPAQMEALVEDVEQQAITAETFTTLFEGLRATDNVDVPAEFRTVQDGLIQRLIVPALKHVGEIGIRIRDNVQEIGGNFGAINKNGITIVSGMPRTMNAQSKTEVLLHEMVHRLSVEALAADPEARTNLANLFATARKHLDYTVFLNKDAKGNVVHLSDPEAEMTHAAEIYDYIFNNSSRITLADGTVIATGLLEFVSYALTNPNFATALKGVRARSISNSDLKFLDGRNEDSLLAKLANWLYTAFASLIDMMAATPKGKDVHQRVFNLVMDLNGLQQQQVEQNARSLSNRIGQAADSVNEAVRNYVDSVTTALTTKGVEVPVATHLREVLKIKLVHAGASLQGVSRAEIDRLIEAISTSADPITAMNQLSSKYSILKDEGFIKSVKDTLTGKLSNEAPNIQRQLNRAVSLTDRQRETMRDGVQSSVKDGFSQRLTAVESEALTPVLLSADMVSLVDRYGIKRAGEILASPKALHDEAFKLEKAIEANNPKFFGGMLEQAKGMASVVIAGVGARENQVSNVHSIVRGTPWPSLPNFYGSHTDAAQLAADLEAYVSLRSLLAVDKSVRSVASDVWAREFEVNPHVNGITNVIQLHRGMKAQALKHLFDNNPAHVVKGYTPQMYDPNLEWQVVSGTKGAELVRKGWKKIYDIADGSEGLALYTRKSNGGTGFVKGALSYENTSARGTTISDAYIESNGGFNNVEIQLQQRLALSANSKAALRQFTKGYRLSSHKNTIAITDTNGKITDYSHIMEEGTKRHVLGKTAHLHEVLGQYAASTISKRNSEAVNLETLDALQEDFAKNYEANPEEFMWVTGEEWNKDGTQNEYFNQYRMLSFEAREAARAKWGDRGIPVRKGFGRVIFGGRKYSIANSQLITLLNERFPNVPLGGIREIAANLEMLWQEIVRIAKVGIVIKMPAVVLMNITSNMMVLAVNRIDPVSASRDAVVAIRELRNYEKLNKEYLLLQVRLRGATSEVQAKRIAVELTRVRSILDASPIRPLLEEGLFQSIVEEVDTSKFGYSDKLAAYVTSRAEQAFGTKAVDIATWLPAQMLMSSSSGAFKFLNKVTQYSDFVARYSYVKRMGMRKNPPAKAEIFRNAVDLFINYNTPDHKGLQWMNDMGIVMFTKYWLGIQHVIMKMFKNQPVEALALVMGQFVFGDIADIMDDSLANKGVSQVVKSPMDVFDSATKLYGVEFWKNLIP